MRPRRYGRESRSLGIRQPLHAGLWRGAIGGTLVDFRIDQVSAAAVNVKISGQVMQPLPKSQQPPGYQPYFYDRPKVCSIKYDRHTFDCPHYTDMHIDNGLCAAPTRSKAWSIIPACSR